MKIPKIKRPSCCKAVGFEHRKHVQVRNVRRLGSHVKDVQCHVYEADYIAMKYDTTGRQQPFKHRGMLARRLADDDPLVIDRLNEYRYGAYVVFARNNTAADEERARRRKVAAAEPEYDRMSQTVLILHF
jgi:hypothetical protein